MIYLSDLLSPECNFYQNQIIQRIFIPMSFQSEIINWYLNHKRDLPWRRTSDAYVIWLSEVILQQTRVEQGLPYFNRFLESYPNCAGLCRRDRNANLKAVARFRVLLKRKKYAVHCNSGSGPL